MCVCGSLRAQWVEINVKAFTNQYLDVSVSLCSYWYSVLIVTITTKLRQIEQVTVWYDQRGTLVVPSIIPTVA